MWDLVADKQMMQSEKPLHVAMCNKIFESPDEGDSSLRYVIHLQQVRCAKQLCSWGLIRSQIAKFVVELGENVAPTDIEEGMRVGVDRTKHSIEVCIISARSLVNSRVVDPTAAAD